MRKTLWDGLHIALIIWLFVGLSACEKKADKQEDSPKEVVPPRGGGCKSWDIISYWITDYVEPNAIVLSTREDGMYRYLELELRSGSRFRAQDASEEFKKLAKAHGEDGSVEIKVCSFPKHTEFCTVGVMGIRVEQTDRARRVLRDVSELYQVYTWGFRRNREVVSFNYNEQAYPPDSYLYEQAALSTLTSKDFFWWNGEVVLTIAEDAHRAAGITRVRVVVEREGKPALTREVCYE